MAQSPCFLSPLADSLLLPLFNPLYLLGNPPSCDRIRPPRSQVACKLTSPFSTLSHSLPHPNSQYPGYLRRLRRLQESGFSCPEHVHILYNEHRASLIIICYIHGVWEHTTVVITVHTFFYHSLTVLIYFMYYSHKYSTHI
jgi:hypothetical protein